MDGAPRLNHRDTADSHTPSITVNKDSVIGVSWYERHDQCLDVYFTASLFSLVTRSVNFDRSLVFTAL